MNETAEDANGPIPAPVSFDYVWGEALDILQKMAPATLEAPGKDRIWVFAFGSETSGIPWTWAAQQQSQRMRA